MVCQNTRTSTGARQAIDRLAPPRQCLIQVSAFQHPKTAYVLLGLQVRPVGDEHLAIGLRPQRLRLLAGVRPPTKILTPAAAISSLSTSISRTIASPLYGRVVAVGVVNRNQILRHDFSFSCRLWAGRLPCLHHIDERPDRNSTKRGEFFYYWLISSAASSPNFFWISFCVSGSKSVKSNNRRTSTISSSEPGMREAHSSASSRDFT